jgi:hypothetical protein
MLVTVVGIHEQLVLQESVTVGSKMARTENPLTSMCHSQSVFKTFISYLLWSRSSGKRPVHLWWSWRIPISIMSRTRTECKLVFKMHELIPNY